MDTNNSVTSPGLLDTINRLNTPSELPQSDAVRLDQSDFLLLLTTQLTQQDPLEPADNEAMAAQLAQFSALSAQTESNDTLATISQQLDALIAAQEAATQAATSAATAAQQAAQDAARAAEAVGAGSSSSASVLPSSAAPIAA